MAKINKNQAQEMNALVGTFTVVNMLAAVEDLVANLPEEYEGTKIAFINLAEVLEDEMQKNKGKYVNYG